MQPIEGRVVVVTGASSGIGASLAERLGARGAKVALIARRPDALKSVAARSGDALAITADVTRRAEVQSAVEQVIARFGHIDVWVNNAGRGISRTVEQLTDEDFDEMMLVNVKSALYGMQAVLPHFRKRGQGHVINVSSMLGRVPFASVRSAYSASKHALNALTANFRTDLRASDPGVEVTLVIPGVVATEFGLNAMHGGIDSRGFPGAQPVEEVADVIIGAIENPRAEVYTRPQYRDQVVAYFAAEDLASLEQNPPFAPPRR